jgi:hypothetical protein
MVSVAKRWALQNAHQMASNDETARDMGPAMMQLQQEISVLRQRNQHLERNMAEMALDQERRHAELLDRFNSLEVSIGQSGRYAPESEDRKRKTPRISGISISNTTPPAPLPLHVAPTATAPVSKLCTVPVQSEPAAASTTPVLTTSALMRLSPPPPMYIFAELVTLLHLYEVWYTRKFLVTGANVSWKSTGPRQRTADISTVMAYTTKVFDGVDSKVRTTLQAAAPPRESAEYGSWSPAFATACSALVRAVTAAIHDQDGKTFNMQATAGALATRLAQLAKKAKGGKEGVK